MLLSLGGEPRVRTSLPSLCGASLPADIVTRSGDRASIAAGSFSGGVLDGFLIAGRAGCAGVFGRAGMLLERRGEGSVESGCVCGVLGSRAAERGSLCAVVVSEDGFGCGVVTGLRRRLRREIRFIVR